MKKQIIEECLELLDIYLLQRGEKRQIVICGGASLILQDFVRRGTMDIDVLAPEIDSELKKAAIEIANKRHLQDGWLNNGPMSLLIDLNEGWESRTVKVFEGRALIVKSLGREDLLFSKVFAYCDRQKDLEDIFAMKPSLEELKTIGAKVKKCDAAEGWSEWVDECLEKIMEG